ncbi:4-aminobutyrate--2-oxoglutarate transaminase [Bacillus sp. FJAT-45350]|uniref:4-aminobutyrate--2-oxoglutarate transaminase n=1 Tax=Bacillus sp. FJAT-45350 TaxID=2011014 RepID=UPI000BB7A054|nr:4-aminobutyrate--2-oxoglutarate transaminase [Bacillus sp. FJAT-45350]
MSRRKWINLKTSIPGPVAQTLIKKRETHIPKGPFNTSKTFIKDGKGAIITDVDGNRLIDFAGAIGSLNVGHCPPELVAKVKEQMDQYIHPCFHVMMYEPYIQLAEKLNALTPGEFAKKTFFLNSGAEAVENAIKIARKYTKRRAVLSFERGFHGRTYMAMSLTSKVKPYKDGFGPFVPDTYKLPYPYYYRSQKGMSQYDVDISLLNRIEDFFLNEVPADDVAAIIIEPVQGEGGFLTPSDFFIQQIKVICEKHKILFIADEIQTGFARTGKLFAIEHSGVFPDLITMSKSLGAGIPISAVTGRADVMDACESGEIGGTYGGSPLGCVAALQVIEIIEKQNLEKRAKEISTIFQKHFKQLQKNVKQIGDVRSIGAMCAIELVKDEKTKEPDKLLTGRIIQETNSRGVVILGAGLYGNVIRLLCPLVITDEQLKEGLEVLSEVIIEETSR